MDKVVWLASAHADLWAIIDYISDDNPDAAQRLKNEIEDKVASLLQNPKLYRQGRVVNTREMIVRSNYVVVYQEEGSVILIVRVLHAAQQWPD